MKEHAMTLDTRLLEILSFPQDKGPLYYLDDEDALYNPRLRRRYAIRNGIPVMLIEEAISVDDDEDKRIMDKVATNAIALTFEAAS
jgi:uncharacterized protein